MPDHAEPSDIKIIYDSECPVCTAYSCSVDMGKTHKPELISARSEDAEVSAAVAAGMDLDDGMVVIKDGKRYHGAEALHILAIAAPNNLFGLWNRLLFGWLPLARLLYPFLRGGRNFLLFILGRKKIGQAAKQRGESEASDLG